MIAFGGGALFSAVALVLIPNVRLNSSISANAETFRKNFAEDEATPNDRPSLNVQSTHCTFLAYNMPRRAAEQHSPDDRVAAIADKDQVAVAASRRRRDRATPELQVAPVEGALPTRA